MTPPTPPIQFPCHCGYLFRVSADQAASAIQCPKCGRLNDVPTLSDLQNLSDDGTLLVRPSQRKPEPNRLAQVNQAFRPGRTDRNGNEIDLRNTQDDLANIGAPREIDEIPLQDDDVRPTKPKYDPLTGELVRPINIAKPPRADELKHIPVAKRALTYAAGDTARIMNARRIAVQMFMPQNVVVMIFVFFFVFIFQLTVGLLGFYIFNMVGMMPTLYMVPIAFLLMAHYANTVEDNGPEAMDELPRPLRSLSLADDVWNPFCNMFTALALCFVPAAICFAFLPPKFTAVALLPLVLGVFFFPAAFLTAVTGSTALNLRPDRLAGVIRAAGGQYAIAFIAWLFALPLFAYSLFGIYMIPYHVREDHPWIYNGNRPVVEFPALFVSIIFLHFACWHLGLIYRRYHDRFPWVFQKHVSVRRQNEAAKAAEIRAQRRKPRYVK